MMMTFLAMATMLASLLIILGGLRMIAQDTFQTLADATMKAHASGQLVPRAAFALLWLLIFSLSYL